jgi:hypothetical protein
MSTSAMEFMFVKPPYDWVENRAFLVFFHKNERFWQYLVYVKFAMKISSIPQNCQG